MHIEVPFYPSFGTEKHPEGEHCTEMAIRMILKYFLPDKEYTLEDVEKITGKEPERGSWEMTYTLWFLNNGFEVKRYSMFDYDEFEKNGIEYIRKTYGDETADYQLATSDILGAQSMVKEYIEKAEIISRKPNVEDIFTEMENGYLVKALVNSCVINDQEGYLGHSVIVTGFDENSIWFNDPGLPPEKNRKVSHQLFQEAMTSFGDEIDAIKPKVNG